MLITIVQMIRVTKDELDALNKTSVQLSDGSGDYLATLDVFHEVHCLYASQSLFEFC